MFAPARFLDFARNDGTKYRFARFYNVICKCGHRRLAYGGSPFAPALVSTSLKMTEAKYRSARLGGGARAPRPTETILRPPKYRCTQTVYPAGGRGTPLPYKASPWGGSCRVATDEGLSFTFSPSQPDPSFVTRFAPLALVPPSPKGEGLNFVSSLMSFRPKRQRSGEIPNGSHPTTPLLQLIPTFKALRGPGHSRKAVSHRGRVYGSRILR